MVLNNHQTFREHERTVLYMRKANLVDIGLNKETIFDSAVMKEVMTNQRIRPMKIST